MLLLLPPELLERVVRHLGLAELLALAQTCAALRAAIRSNRLLWRSLLATRCAGSAATATSCALPAGLSAADDPFAALRFLHCQRAPDLSCTGAALASLLAVGQPSIARCDVVRRDAGREYVMSLLFVEGSASPSVSLPLVRAVRVPQQRPWRPCAFVLLDAAGTPVAHLERNAVGTCYRLLSADRTRELAAVVFRRNMMGARGPRQLSVVLPGFDPVTGATIRVPNAAGGAGESRLLDAYRSGTDGHVIVLRNSPPKWSAESRSYVLNLDGRVRVPSVKNFRIDHGVDARGKRHAILLVGKVAPNHFAVDWKRPFSPITALCPAVASFDRKVGVE